MVPTGPLSQQGRTFDLPEVYPSAQNKVAKVNRHENTWVCIT